MAPKRCTCVQATEFWKGIDLKEAIEADEREQKQRRDYIERLFVESQLPSKWRERTFERYQLTDTNKEAYEKSIQYAKNFNKYRGNGLILTGNVGLGKTHLAAAITMELLSRGNRVIFGTVTSLLATIKNTFENDKESEKDAFNRLTHCDLLVIDDLGKEKVTEWVAQYVYEIINARYDDNKSIVITTNMKLAQIKEKYNSYDKFSGTGDAIVSRIVEACDSSIMTGSDYRKRNYTR